MQTLKPFPLPLLLLFPLLGACADDDGSGSGTEGVTETGESTGDGNSADGRAYFDGPESAALGAAGNEVLCSTCHSIDGTIAGYSGESMQNIAFRTVFKAGFVEDFREAINSCVVVYMGGEPMAADSPEYLGLADFLESISDPSVTEPNGLNPELLDNEAAYEAAYAGGDATAGAAKYTTNCAVCHDNALSLGAVAAFPKASLAAYSIGRIAQQVRTSGAIPSGLADPTDSTPGPMPYFEFDELSTTDLADIIAHLKAG